MQVLQTAKNKTIMIMVIIILLFFGLLYNFTPKCSRGNGGNAVLQTETNNNIMLTIIIILIFFWLHYNFSLKGLIWTSTAFEQAAKGCYTIES
jgi:hypothetical protein